MIQLIAAGLLLAFCAFMFWIRERSDSFLVTWFAIVSFFAACVGLVTLFS